MLVGTSAAEGFWFKSLQEYTEGLTRTNAFGSVRREIG
jgi:phage terminase large subunit-like protein